MYDEGSPLFLSRFITKIFYQDYLNIIINLIKKRKQIEPVISIDKQSFTDKDIEQPLIAVVVSGEEKM